MITAIFTKINMTWIANHEVSFQRRWFLAYASCFVDQLIVRLEEDPVAHFVILPNYQEDETMLHETLESWLLFFGRGPHA